MNFHTAILTLGGTLSFQIDFHKGFSLRESDPEALETFRRFTAKLYPLLTEKHPFESKPQKIPSTILPPLSWTLSMVLAS